MELDWSSLLLLCLAGAIVWFWQDSLAAREKANAAALEACNSLALQLLDGTVAFARIRLTRARGGRLHLQRTYVFDYTANSIERRQGFVVLSGRQVDSVGYAQGDAQQPTVQAEAVKPEAPAKILHIEHWRNRPRPVRRPSTEDREDSAR